MDGLAEDLLLGGGAIARELFGEDTRKNRRKVYHLHELGLLGLFKCGSQVAARRSTMRGRIADHERNATHSSDDKSAA